MSDALATLALEPEVDAQPSRRVRVLALLSPFSMARAERYVAEGTTLLDIVTSLELESWKDAMVAIDGRPVEPRWWRNTCPKPDHLVTVRAIPRGGGSSSDKGWIQIAAGVVLIAVGIILAFTVWGAPIAPYLIAMGAGLVISGAVTLIFPPPSVPKLSSGAADDAPVFSITGSRNNLNPYGVIPRVYGRHKVFPIFGALPFTELVGNVQYVRELFIIGYGPYELSDFRIGETPIANFAEVEVEIRQGYPSDPPMTLYSNTVHEEVLALSLVNNVEPVRQTDGAVDEFSVDFVFAAGLYHINGNGQIVEIGTRIQISYRKLGDVTWIVAEDKTHVAKTTQPLRRSFRQIVGERAVYEVKMRQFGAGNGQGLGAVVSIATWARLRSILYEEPITLPGLCRVAIRIKATDQLNGVVDSFNCIAHSILPDYDVLTNSWVQRATSNPASVYRDILQGSANARPLADDRLDLPALQAWHTDCDLRGRTFSFVVEQRTTVAELLRQVVAVGRATLGSVDGTFGVVRDILQTVPVQHFTPRNSRNFSGGKLFRDMPDAIKCQFINPDTNWEIDEVFVYRDGFNEFNANKFQSLQFFGVTSSDQAYKSGRYHLADAQLRPEVYSFETDVEHIVCTRGDLIRLTHDVPLFGIKSGRIKSVTLNVGGAATGVTVDEVLPMEAGHSYDMRIRRADASTPSVVAAVTTVVGDQLSVTFTTPISAATLPVAGDLFMFGEVGQQSIEAIVTRIEMLKDLGARIICVDAAPAIHNIETEPIPPHDPQITLPPERRPPPEPEIFGLTSEGTLVSRSPTGSIGTMITVHWTFPSSENLVGATMQAAWRPSGVDVTDPWTRFPEEPLAEANAVALGPLAPGSMVDIRIRAVSTFAVPSDWVHVILIDLPNPPVLAGYSLEVIADGYLARIDRRIGPPPPPVVRGLRLVNSLTGGPNDTDFAGIEAKLAWNAVALHTGSGDGEDDITVDSEIRDYIVNVLSGGILRHEASRTVANFTYAYEQNIEDHAGIPARTLLIRVWARGQDGQLSPSPAELTVQNPGPDMSQILPTLTPAVGAIVVDWKSFVSSDYDLDRFEILVDTVSPPVVVAMTSDIVHREAIVAALSAGVPYFVQIVPYDAFGIGIASQIATATPTAANLDMFVRSFTPEGIIFAFDAITNQVAWTAGTLNWTVDGSTIEARDITADSATWTGPSLFIYYVLGETIFRTTTTVALALGTDRAVMAVYLGGTTLNVNWGKVMIHGTDVLAGTLGSAALITNQAIITGSAQIANAIINNAHITSLAADKITAGSILSQILIGAGRIATAETGARVELAGSGLDVYNASNQSVVKAQEAVPHFRIGRTIADGALVEPIELSSSGDLEQFITNQFTNLAVIRQARARSTGLSQTSGTETIKATYTDLIRTVRAEDTIGTWWQVSANIDDITGAGGSGIIRLRRGTTTIGTLIGSFTVTIGPSKTGVPVKAWRTFHYLQAPFAANTDHSYVITMQIISVVGSITLVVDESAVMLLAKSA
jgi:Putative phage tail protein